MRVAFHGEKMFVESVTGAILEQLRERCRGCKVPEVAFHYLMKGDQILQVNDKSDLVGMVKLLRASAEMLIVVRREWDPFVVESSDEGLHSASTNVALCAPINEKLQLEEGEWGAFDVQQEYEPSQEPAMGYLAVHVGVIVYVMLGSRSSPDSSCMHACDYVYAVTRDGEGLRKGWIPINILYEERLVDCGRLVETTF